MDSYLMPFVAERTQTLGDAEHSFDLQIIAGWRVRQVFLELEIYIFYWFYRKQIKTGLNLVSHYIFDNS
jgi:hypothetical protein